MRTRKAAYRARRQVRQEAGSQRRKIKAVARDSDLVGIDLSDARVRQALGVAYGPDNEPS